MGIGCRETGPSFGFNMFLILCFVVHQPACLSACLPACLSLPLLLSFWNFVYKKENLPTYPVYPT